jgi:hypothetical protein
MGVPRKPMGEEEKALRVPVDENQMDDGTWRPGKRPPANSPMLSGEGRKEMVRRSAIAKSNIKTALRSIEREFPSEDMGTFLKIVWNLALEERNPKGALGVIEFVMSYQHGKPVNRQLNVNSTLDQFRKVFGDGAVNELSGGDEEEEEDEDVVEAGVVIVERGASSC